MLLKILDEIDKALSNEMYISALYLLLSVPDICAKAEYPEIKQNKERYIKWFDEWIGQYAKSPVEEGDVQTPYLSGELVYNLRCQVLHQGTPNIEKDKIKAEECKIDRFVLVVQKKNEYGVYGGNTSTVWYKGMTSEVEYREYEVNIHNLYIHISEAAKHYYAKNKEKFNFFNYEIMDWDEATARFEKPDMDKVF